MQYEIIAGGAGARATKDGASGITVNQSNAKIAPIEIIESEFPTRLLRFELIKDSGGAGRYPRRARHPPRISQSRGRALLDPLDEARDPAERLRRRQRPDAPATSGSIRTAKDAEAPADPLRRLSARRRATCSGSTRPAAAATAMRCEREPERVLDDVREGVVSPEAAERDYGVVLKRDGGDFVVDAAATQARRAKVTMWRRARASELQGLTIEEV